LPALRRAKRNIAIIIDLKFERIGNAILAAPQKIAYQDRRRKDISDIQ